MNAPAVKPEPAAVELSLSVGEFQIVKRTDVPGMLIRHFDGHTMQCTEDQLVAHIRQFWEANF